MSVRRLAPHPPADPHSGGAKPRCRDIAEQHDWSVTEYVCTAGPADRPFEEQHGEASLALVAAGTFHYRTGSERAVLYPGAILLGNAGATYECSHQHSAGDRCISLQVSAELLAEIAAGTGAARPFRFRSPMLPALPRLTAAAVAIERCAAGAEQMATAELVLSFVETVVATLTGEPSHVRRPSPSESRRISRVLRYVEERSTAALDLAELAGVAAMSKYHFLRIFRRVTGTTPHQHLLATRLRRAANALIATRLPVGTIAANEGFGDLSTFNHLFRRTLHMTPLEMRASA